MNSPGEWILLVEARIEKETRDFPRHDRVAIKEAICALAVDPYYGDIQKTKGERDVWRRRVGSYRIFYEIDTTEHAILVFRVERRTSGTY